MPKTQITLNTRSFSFDYDGLRKMPVNTTLSRLNSLFIPDLLGHLYYKGHRVTTVIHGGEYVDHIMNGAQRCIDSMIESLRDGLTVEVTY